MALLHDIIHDVEHRADPNYIPNKVRAGRIGGVVSTHLRWHVWRGMSSPKCRLCTTDLDALIALYEENETPIS